MTMDRLAEARRLLDWGDEYLRVTDVALAVRHLADAIEELRPPPPAQFHARNAANCRDTQGHPPVAGVVCETCATQPDYSRCPRCGVEHTDRPGKLCYHCGLEPPGEPETVPVLLPEHRDRTWGWVWDRSEPQHFGLYYRYRNGWQYSHDRTNWHNCEDEQGRTWLPDANVPGEGGFFTAVEEA
ncbi:hypothetical protein [Mycolicibacter heraklionensis]|uniref:hypothetical protein n=1 Tax=Mycolicibacter heraklionensis TaxID=512402 RepID=UPI0009EE81CC|nr:hypothetical protein [Mycolicibacter heraklionensis]